MGRIWHRGEKSAPGICQMVERERKVESLKSVLNIRTLVKPGITYIDFGPADLMFDMESQDHPYLKSVSDCREFISKELEDVNVRLG